MPNVSGEPELVVADVQYVCLSSQFIILARKLGFLRLLFWIIPKINRSVVNPFDLVQAIGPHDRRQPNNLDCCGVVDIELDYRRDFIAVIAGTANFCSEPFWIGHSRLFRSPTQLKYAFRPWHYTSRLAFLMPHHPDP